MADRAGRLKARYRTIQASLFPFDTFDVEDIKADVSELERNGLVTRYYTRGEEIIQVQNFEKHQRFSTREPLSTLPPPEKTNDAPVVISTVRQVHDLAQCPALGREGEGKGDREGEGKGKDLKHNRAGARAIQVPLLVPQDAPEASKPNEHARLLEAFSAAWERTYRARYTPTPADKSQLGRLMASTPKDDLADLPARFERYLRDTDAFLVEKVRHSLAFFCTNGGANRYAVDARVAKTPAEKTALFVARMQQEGT
jgi:hypothetical protein